MNNKIQFIHMDEYGVLPDRAICPICGEEVEVIKMAYKGDTPHLSKAPGRIELSGGSSSTQGELSCGHKFSYREIDHNSLEELKDNFSYIYKIREFAEQGQYSLNNDQKYIISKVREDIEKIFSLTEDDISRLGEYFTLKYNDYEAYEKLYNHFGDIKITFEELEFFYGIKRKNPLDNPSFTIEEFESLCNEDKKDSRYIMYLEEIISKNWGEIDEDGFIIPPINFWEIPEENKRNIYEYTIKIFSKRDEKDD